MPELFTSISSIAIILAQWIFTALMINMSLTRKFSRITTVFIWFWGLVILAGISTVLMSLYGVFVPVIPLDSFDLIGLITDGIIVCSAIAGFIIITAIAYKESGSAKFYISSFFVLITLIFSDVVVNIVKLVIPVEQYFTSIYFIYQFVIYIVILLAMLEITYKSLAPRIKSLIKDLKGNMGQFVWASALCITIYVAMALFFNTQATNIFDNSQFVPRIVFLILCITMYFVIIYGLKNTIKFLNIESELSVAKNIQLSILPSEDKLKKIPNLKIAARMIPYSEVGGDFYDVIELDSGKTAFMVTDIAGKGVPAAMFMMRTKSFLKLNMRYNKSPGPVLTFANGELLKNNDLCMFYTAVVGVYDSKTSMFSYSCGGHFPPILIRDGKAVSCEGSHDPVIGIKDYTYNQFEIELKKDDMIFFYTDGVTDTVSKKGDRYGSERLVELLSKESEPDMLISDLIKDINKFCGHGDYADDLTILAFKVL